MFVCYAHADKNIVYPEIRWLHDQGINLWYDEGISAGAEFPERLGSADEHKVMKVYETDHIPPKSDYIAEILAWLDRYLGPPGETGTVTTDTAEEPGPSPQEF